jgi:hypothetical protein
VRKAKVTYWANDIRARLRFERGAREAFPDLAFTVTGRTFGARVIYTLTVDVPHYERRRITMVIANAVSPYFIEVTADGPTESPHRYSTRKLCIWQPDSAPEERWVGEDGLLSLIDHTRVHLFKEAYWREMKIWAGREAPHASVKVPDQPPTRETASADSRER